MIDLQTDYFNPFSFNYIKDLFLILKCFLYLSIVSTIDKYFMRIYILFAVMMCSFLFCTAKEKTIIIGAAQTGTYFPLLKQKKVALFSNQTGMVGDKLTIDILVEHGIHVVTIFSPEHGFRGDADAGKRINNSIDAKTGIPIYSLYNGKKKIPAANIMNKFDVLVVDIQDVGLRFYTYYITMFHLMDACAKYHKTMLILDRPNPNGFYVDGPILDMKYKSGVGCLPIPVVYGMTLGELAQMINGEHWLPDSEVCKLKIIPCQNYTHQTKYQLPIAPSPNLPNMKSVYLYPSLCYFEGTPISIGRGTTTPFQIYGHPNMMGYTFNFTPQKMLGANNPPQLNKTCYGIDLRGLTDQEIWNNGLDLSYVIKAYKNLNIGDNFFHPFFELLIGVDYVRKMIEANKSAAEIKAMWKNDDEKFKIKRRPYLLYNE